MRTDGLDNIQAIGILQRYVDDGKVGRSVTTDLQGLLHVLGFAADDHVELVIDELRETFANEGMILNNNHALFRSRADFPGPAEVRGMVVCLIDGF